MQDEYIEETPCLALSKDSQQRKEIGDRNKRSILEINENPGCYVPFHFLYCYTSSAVKVWASVFCTETGEIKAISLVQTSRKDAVG